LKLLDNEIRLFLKSKKILVFDDKRASRLEIKNGLLDLGVNPKKILMERDFNHAKNAIHTYAPEIIISEFQVHDHYGLELARLQMDLIGDYIKKIFIIVTGNASQASVADAAEEEVDAFLVKPFTKDLVSDYLYKAVSRKINPSAYASMVYEAKKLIIEDALDLAEQTLAMSKIMYERPMMACYYTGLIHLKRNLPKDALEQFNSGLSFNALHFKCLTGKFRAMIELNKKQQAFKCLEVISEHFPLTPDLLKRAFILSITSYHFDRVEMFYERYLNQPRKTKDLKLTVSQALLTAGKILLRERRHPKLALDYFKKGAIITAKKKEFLAGILDTLIKEGFSHEADNFFNLFDARELPSQLIKQFRFKAFAKIQHKHPDEVIERGKGLIFDGIADAGIAIIVCDLLKKSGRKKLLQSVAYKAIELFPNHKASFLSYLDQAA